MVGWLAGWLVFWLAVRFGSDQAGSYVLTQADKPSQVESGLVGWLAGWLFGWLVGRWVGWWVWVGPGQVACFDRISQSESILLRLVCWSGLVVGTMFSVFLICVLNVALYSPFGKLSLVWFGLVLSGLGLVWVRMDGWVAPPFLVLCFVWYFRVGKLGLV